MDRKRIIISRIAVMCISVCFIAIGISKSEYSDVLQKAIRVCLECIGIG